jgi:hypothetical protein
MNEKVTQAEIMLEPSPFYPSTSPGCMLLGFANLKKRMSPQYEFL